MIKIFTIGHSNRSWKQFVELLKSVDIQTVVDCRSYPRSRWEHFNVVPMRHGLYREGIKYEGRGENLGGRGRNVKYEETLNEMRVRAEMGERIALMCSEGDPANCHRGTILTPALEERGVELEHLMYDGKKKVLAPPQPSLFDKA